MSPDSLPPVPPKVILPGQPVVMPRTGTRVAMPAPRAAAPAIRTAFDSAPAATLAIRAAAEKARNELQAAVRAVLNAKVAAEAAIAMSGADTAERGKDAAARSILAIEGVSVETLKDFNKAAAPIIAAFVLPDVPAETPSPAAA